MWEFAFLDRCRVRRHQLPAIGSLIFVFSLPALANDLAQQPLDLSGFADGIAHWQKKNDLFDYPRCDIRDTDCIADNILMRQRDNGGWPKNFDPQRLLQASEKTEILRQKGALDATFDNRNVFTEIDYMAAAYDQTGDERYKASVVAGLQYILKTQYSSGGWPHTAARAEAYYPHVTIADGVMPGVLGLLRRIVMGDTKYRFLTSDLREQLTAALTKGDQLLLDLQIRRDGKRLGWAGQYDRKTLLPVQGRSFELPALVSWETVDVLMYLTSIDQPTADQKVAIVAATRWLQAASLTGFRIQEVAAERVRYEYHASSQDREVVDDPKAPRIWARFYDLDSGAPFLANRTGEKVMSLSEVERERRTGYDWYGYWPESYLTYRYPEWQSRIQMQSSKRL